jgi:hypothetical protein
MKPGDSIVVHPLDAQSWIATGRYAGMKFVRRKIDNEQMRIWRIE